MAFELPDLPYPYEALEPHIDEATMRVHHDAHHAAYVNNANAALEGSEWADRPVEHVLANLELVPEEKRTAASPSHTPGQIRTPARSSLFLPSCTPSPSTASSTTQPAPTTAPRPTTDRVTTAPSCTWAPSNSTAASSPAPAAWCRWTS